MISGSSTNHINLTLHFQFRCLPHQPADIRLFAETRADRRHRCSSWPTAQAARWAMNAEYWRSRSPFILSTLGHALLRVALFKYGIHIAVRGLCVDDRTGI